MDDTGPDKGFSWIGTGCIARDDPVAKYACNHQG